MSTNIDYSGNGDVLVKQTDVNSSIQYSTDNITWTDIIWPIYIQNSSYDTLTLNVKIQSNLNITNVNNVFIINGHNITIDGNNYNITVTDVTNFSGLIQNGTGAANGYNNITIQNLKIASSGSTTVTAGMGWICQSYFGKATTTNTIQNCTSSGIIPNNGGGIIGSNAGASSTTFTVLNCSASGDIFDVNWGANAGGIIGDVTGSNASLFTIQNCSFSGGINGNGAGGIVGGKAYNVTIKNCSSSGTIKGGGIVGSNAGQNDGTVTVTDCYSTGTIGSNGGSYAGGIVGENAGNISVTKCYSIGKIGGAGLRQAGGIIGLNAGINNCSVTISKCFSAGDIYTNCGGIANQYFGINSNKCTIINCYSIGNQTSYNSGGIVGPIVGKGSVNGVDIINCFSLGSFGTNGGIIAVSEGSGYGTVKVTSCYAYAKTTNDNGVIATGSTLIPVVNNFYSANNSWSDTDANTFLTEIDTIWKSISPNKPYKLAEGLDALTVMSLSTLLTATVSISSLRLFGATLVALISEGVTLEALISEGVTLSTLIAEGITLADLTASGITFSLADLIAEGSTKEDLIAAGATVEDLIAAGATIEEILSPIITKITTSNQTVQIYFNQITDAELPSVTNYSYSIDGLNYIVLDPIQITSPLIISGLTNRTEYSFTLQALLSSGGNSIASNTKRVIIKPTLEELITSTEITMTEILNYNYTLQAMKDAGYKGDRPITGTELLTSLSFFKPDFIELANDIKFSAPITLENTSEKPITIRNIGETPITLGVGVEEEIVPEPVPEI